MNSLATVRNMVLPLPLLASFLMSLWWCSWIHFACAPRRPQEKRAIASYFEGSTGGKSWPQVPRQLEIRMISFKRSDGYIPSAWCKASTFSSPLAQFDRADKGVLWGRFHVGMFWELSRLETSEQSPSNQSCDRFSVAHCCVFEIGVMSI